MAKAPKMTKASSKARKLIAQTQGFTPTETPATQKTAHFSMGGVTSVPITKSSQYGGEGFVVTASDVAMSQPMFFSPMHTPQNWQIASRRIESYNWARFYAQNEPKVAAGLDFYANFPMNGFTVECSNKKVKKYFEAFVEDIKLHYWLRLMSYEYHLLGDVFPYLSIHCPVCDGRGTVNGKKCNHPDGKFKSITVLNPEFVDVGDSPYPDQREIHWRPDQQLANIVKTRQPKAAYDRIPEEYKKAILTGTPIAMSHHCVSHIKHSECPYDKYGQSMIRRLFTVLAYKSKLMTANWITAERLILPIRIVKVGEKENPATPEDVADMQQQLLLVANDPNLTIVTHHAVEFDWQGATGKIHNITAEMEYIGKEILDGLMLNQALLNGEIGSVSGTAIGVETLIKRLDTWRDTLADWVRDKIFKPMSEMQGFIDEEESEDMGKKVYIIPTIKWNEMQLRDKSNRLQMFVGLHDKKLISTRRLLEEFDIDYDQEIMELREETAMQSPGGMVDPNGAPMGDMGGGGGGGGMPPMDMGGGGAPPPPGGDPAAGGMPPMDGGAGGMPPAGGAPAGGPPPMGASASASGMVVHKRGKAPKKKEVDLEYKEPTMIKLNKLEQKTLKIIKSLQAPFQVYAQYELQLPGEQYKYSLDFAIPDLKLCVEANGKIWHEQEGQEQKDKIRDSKMSRYGWTVIRFTEDSINSQANEVRKVLAEVLKQLLEYRASMNKKASNSFGMTKYASFDNQYLNLGLYGKVQIISFKG